MKIAFVGAHSTGKTSLSHFLQENSETPLTLIEEVSQSIIDRGLDWGQYASSEAYIQYIQEQLNAEVKLSKYPGIVISDRCILDAVAYASANKKAFYTSLPGAFINMMIELARFETLYFDYYVYFPTSIPFQQSPNRPEDINYRVLVDDFFVKTLEKLEIEYITMKGTIEERAKQITSLRTV